MWVFVLSRHVGAWGAVLADLERRCGGRDCRCLLSTTRCCKQRCCFITATQPRCCLPCSGGAAARAGQPPERGRWGGRWRWQPGRLHGQVGMDSKLLGGQQACISGRVGLSALLAEPTAAAALLPAICICRRCRNGRRCLLPPPGALRLPLHQQRSVLLLLLLHSVQWRVEQVAVPRRVVRPQEGQVARADQG